MSVITHLLKGIGTIFQESCFIYMKGRVTGKEMFHEPAHPHIVATSWLGQAEVRIEALHWISRMEGGVQASGTSSTALAAHWLEAGIGSEAARTQNWHSGIGYCRIEQFSLLGHNVHLAFSVFDYFFCVISQVIFPRFWASALFLAVLLFIETFMKTFFFMSLSGITHEVKNLFETKR